MSTEIPVIAIDGPSGVGKGTLALALARRLNWHYLESGALYRVLGFLAHRDGAAFDDADALAAMAARLNLTFEGGQVWLDGESVDAHIRNEAAGKRASKIAPLPEVRAALKQWQRRCARRPGLVADGRDMGSVVFADSRCKIFLRASAAARAKRRYLQLQHDGFSVTLAEIERQMAARDERDLHRAASPLTCAEDAFALDTTELSVAEVMAAAWRRVQQIYPQTAAA